MVCPKCSQALPDGSKFCNGCGSNIIEVSPKRQSKLSLVFIVAILSPLVILAGILIYSIADTYVITPLERKGMSVEKLICDKLNIWNEKHPDKSGITGIKKIEGTDGDYALWYNFYPLGTQEISYELALEIAEKLISTFGERKELNKISVIVKLPYRDEYLKTVWNPYVYFDLNRETLAKYSYENFVSKDLYIVSDNLKFLDE